VTMDHIPYPLPSPNPPITTPYHIRAEHLYDHLDFETFAKRKRVSWPSPEIVETKMESRAPDVIDDAYSVVQSWLFFGLLEEVRKLLLPEASVFEREELIERDSGSRVNLITKAVPDMLVEWELQDRDATQSARMSILKTVASRLELAMGFATGLYELAEHFTVLEWISTELFLEVQKLILCIYILTETLGKPGYLHQVFLASAL